MPEPAAPAAPRCPRTGRSRAQALARGGMRPSDLLTAFLATGVTWLLAAIALGVAAAASGNYGMRWLALHFAFVGGISQLVLGAAQFFVCAFLATDPPSRRMVRTQLVVWNAGTVFVAVGVRADLTPLSGIGGTALLVGLALFAVSLRGMQRRSLQRQPWAARWYLTSAAFLAVGATLGPMIAAGTRWTHGSLLAAHIVLNLGGWFGTAIVGTLHTFYPSLTATQLRHPRLQPVSFAAWTVGITAIAIGSAFYSQPLAAAGWALLIVAALALGWNMIASTRAAERRPTPAVLVGAAQLFAAAAAVAGLVLTIGDGTVAPQLGSDRMLVALPAVAGWIGLTVAGSLLHLLPLMARVRNMARPPVSGSGRVPVAAGTAVLLGTAVTVLARIAGTDSLLAIGAATITLGYLTLAARIASLALRAVRAAPLRV